MTAPLFDMTMRSRLFAVLASLIPLFAATAGAADPDTSTWDRRAGVKWSGTPLRESLARFAEIQQIGFFLDRRVDPSRPLHFEAANRPLGRLLDDLAESLDLGCHRFDSTVYLGPKNGATSLPVLLEQHREALDGLPGPTVDLFRVKIPLSIPFLAEPKELLRALGREHGFHWRDLDTLPHDLWDECSLPEMPLCDLTTLLLLGFGMDYSIAVERRQPVLEVVPIPENILSSRNGATPAAEKTVQAPTEERTADPPVPVPLARRRFTVRVEEQRLDAVLKMLTERLGLKLELDEKSLEAKGVPLDHPVSFDVKNATAPELFRTILKPLRLEFRLRGDSVLIR